MYGAKNEPHKPKRFSISLDRAGQNLPNSNWDIAPANSYRDACATGRIMAANFLQQLKDDPDYVGAGILGHIAADINFNDETAGKGYWVGFFSYLESHLYESAKHCDLHADLARIEADSDSIV
ncbi:hypothetical protein [Marinomonas transparens]|uniref:Uncharacterized protein n=1 Tax=Marinomonas transparens TaxID=2795388 RepID=A0A934K027_9GAMM|nr:hypothetical protein [Marinomonas transparens]MBJ7540042.1 hypothetical protein [Marinomonas transparens]